MPFKTYKPRQPKVKPIWHVFNCLDCGMKVREFSDPRASLYLCIDCMHTRQGIAPKAKNDPLQQPEPADWWTLFCLEYESKKQSPAQERLL